MTSRSSPLLLRPVFLIRSFLATIFFLAWTLFFSTLGFFLNLFFNTKKIDDQVIGTWARGVCFFFNAKIEVKGTENIPNGGCLFLFSHSSFFDIFALAGSFSHLRFGAKSELFKLPMFGLAMKRTGTLPIVRGRREETFKIYEEAKGRFLNGESFALSPEGGRFYGPNLAPFKAGPFVFAMSAGVPLVPVVIQGAHETLPKENFLANSQTWGSRITLTILPPIETKPYALENRHELQIRTYEVMNAVWSKSPS